MKDVGFIGLGTMGRPMASHILAAGYPCSCMISHLSRRS